MKKVTVHDLLNEKEIPLELKLLSGKRGLNREFRSSEIHRPVMELLGHGNKFIPGELQVLGLEEFEAVKQAGKDIEKNLSGRMLSGDVPCFVMTAGIQFPDKLMKVLTKTNIPVMKTALSTTIFINRASVFFDNKMAPKTTVQGVMMDVYGMGILITGESGIGKSESALELLKRGHLLIADDMVGIKQRSGSVLIAYSMTVKHHYLEVRGLGIIDIENVFGIGSVRNAIKVELIVRLQEWDKTVEYDRLGLERRFTTILGIKIPEVVVPVSAGRNLAVIIELAAKNQKLKNEGFYAAHELNKQLMSIIRKKEKIKK